MWNDSRSSAQRKAGEQEHYLWPFDFEPYDIQKDLMYELYETLDHGQVGIFESPTGSGKSLSIISSALHWLKVNRGKVLDADMDRNDLSRKTAQDEKNKSTGGELDWITAFADQKREEARSDAEEKQRQRRERVEQRRGEKLRPARKRARQSKLGQSMKQDSGSTSDSEFVLEDLGEEDADAAANDWRARAYESDDEVYGQSSNAHEDEDLSTDEPRKIFFCSRTHSQLSQFMNEIRRTPFGASIPSVALGSRKQLCTNDTVRGLGSNSRINEKCLDLIDQARKSDDNGGEKKGAKSRRGGARDGRNGVVVTRAPARSACPLFDKNSISRLSDEILYEARDIESIADIAKDEQACGYYASRVSVRDAEFVALPYSMLLHRKTRESLGIRLKGNIVICDEAHNVIEAINEVHSVTLSLAELTQAHADLLAYRDRYRTRLNPSNKVSVNQLLIVIAGLQNFLEQKAKQKCSSVMTCGKVVSEADVEHINIFPLLDFLERSRLAQKLRGFAEKYIAQKEKVGEVVLSNMKERKRVHAKEPGAPLSGRKPRAAASLRPVQAFLEGLVNTEKDGKVLIVGDGPRTMMKFLMLHPGTHFREIVDEAHAVILAGGTMKPTADVETQLFGHLPRSQIRLFSCGHVIPKENMLCLCMGTGPTRTPLELTFANRTQHVVMDEIVRSLVNMCTIIPYGVVVFLPSYSYAEQLFARWKSQKQWERLEAKKTVICDTRDAHQAERLLDNYAAAARTRRGALLFSVVGGKLSEGINFKDELARCVVMVGLPFPNAQDPELKAKMEFLDRGMATMALSGQPKLTSKDFYENLCMKAVNQCIGRAIRHRDDYAAVVLMDSRYARPNIVAKLPRWIVGDDKLESVPHFGAFVQRMRKFLATKIPPEQSTKT